MKRMWTEIHFKPIAIAFVCSLSMMCVDAAMAAEPIVPFLEALREAGYHELALEYLDRLAKDPSVDRSIRDTIANEKGKVLLEAARRQVDLPLREKMLGEAEDQLKTFTKQAPPESDLVISAQMDIGNAILERARIQQRLAERNPASNSPYVKAASKLFDESRKIFAQSQALIRPRLEAYPKGLSAEKNPDEYEQREALRSAYVQAQLTQATTLYEKAELLGPDHKSYTKTLESAEESFKTVARKYSKLTAGIYATLYQGRCKQKQKSLKDALAIFVGLVDYENSPGINTIRAKALLSAIECWIEKEVDKPDEAIKRGEEFVATVKGLPKNHPDLLGVKLTLAKAYKYKVDAGLENAQKIARFKLDARKLAREVNRFPSIHQRDAQLFLAQLGNVAESSTAENTELPSGFQDSHSAAMDAWEEMETSSKIKNILSQRIKSISDPKSRAEIQTQLDSSRATAKETEQQAMQLFQHALTQSTLGTPVETINSIRYHLCYLFYKQSQYYEAAILGDFLAKRYPETPGARQAALIAMASYLKLYSSASAQSESKDGLVVSIVETAELIRRRWPEQREAQDALNTLVRFMIQQGKLDEAEGYLKQIPGSSPRRGEAELQTGQALWRQYISKVYQDSTEPDAQRADAEMLDELKNRAQSTLEAGIKRMKQQPPNTTLLTAILSLSQIYIDTNQPKKAIDLLTDPKTGPKALLDAGSPLTQVGNIPEETHRAAIRANISMLGQSSTPKQQMDEAIKSMDALKALVGESSEGKKRLVSIYVNLAQDLQRQIKVAPDDQRSQLSQGFESFLQRVGESSNEFSIANWIAESFFSLAEGFSSKSGKPGKEAKGYYAKAAEGYRDILANAQKYQLNEATTIQLKLRIAATEQKSGNFTAAIDAYEGILKVKETTLNVQVDAAEALQAWGDSGEPEAYRKAIVGDRINKKKRKYTIWGWARLAAVTKKYEQFQGTYFESRYRVAECRYRYALKQKGTKRAKTMKQAKGDIVVTAKNNPKLGGPTSRKRYDVLLKKVQKALNEDATGLAGLQKA